ncbi:hypothetical protein OsI_32724 [Oryza sativa Indica Group]|uniref:Uncharacterized protein n=1 Tax=Oryza sativa subsp. indica TaxID=39946 RepID=B8BFQ4_ORYSI|nr:hypothetical protein OsI_32724 [Oryza sativa Indica Group]
MSSIRAASSRTRSKFWLRVPRLRWRDPHVPEEKGERSEEEEEEEVRAGPTGKEEQRHRPCRPPICAGRALPLDLRRPGLANRAVTPPGSAQGRPCRRSGAPLARRRSIRLRARTSSLAPALRPAPREDDRTAARCLGRPGIAAWVVSLLTVGTNRGLEEREDR